MLQDLWIRLAGGENKRKAGGVKEELHERGLFNDGVLLHHIKECGLADHEVTPHFNHASSGLSKGRAAKKYVVETAHLIRAARKSAKTVRVVSNPMFGKKIGSVSARYHSRSNNCLSHFKWASCI